MCKLFVRERNGACVLSVHVQAKGSLRAFQMGGEKKSEQTNEQSKSKEVPGTSVSKKKYRLTILPSKENFI